MSEEASYYLRFISFFIDVATEKALQVVNKCTNHDVKTHLTLINTKQNLLKLLKDKVLTNTQFNLISAPVPNPNHFDLNLLIILLCNSVPLPPPKQGWENHPGQTDLSISADILRLRKIRNSVIAHSTRATLRKYKFDRLWSDLEQILYRITTVTAPGTEKELLDKIEHYRNRKLDIQNEQRYLQKLEEWWKNCEEVSKLQEKVEELVKKCNEFALFFRDRPEKYSNYVRLLFEGGRIVLSNFLTKQISEQGRDLCIILRQNQEVIENCIGNQEMYIQLFPTDSTDPVNTDTDTWDILVLAHVIEITLKPKLIKVINVIKDARINYAEDALLSVHDQSRFSFRCEDLVAAIKTLSVFLDDDIQTKCEEQIQHYRTMPATNLTTDVDDYLGQLKSHGTEIKSLSDLYKETLESLKTSMNEMEEDDICFKNDHVLDLKMITLGEIAEKKRLAEDMLETVWQAALKMTKSPEEFEAVRLVVDNILEDIRNKPGVEAIDLSRGCILISLRCCSCHSLVEIIDYMISERFEEHLADLSTELGYINDAIIRIEGRITFESLHTILKNQQNYKDRGLNLPVTCSSPEGMREIFKLLGSKETTNRINQIAGSLSLQVKETISVKLFPEPRVLSGVFDDTDNETASSSDSQIDDVEYSDRNSAKYKNRPEVDDRKEIDGQEDTLLKDAYSIREMVLENKESKDIDKELKQDEETTSSSYHHIDDVEFSDPNFTNQVHNMSDNYSGNKPVDEDRIEQDDMIYFLLPRDAPSVDLTTGNKVLENLDEQLKREFKLDLVELYQQHYVTMWPSPILTQDNDANISAVYVPPNMVFEQKDGKKIDESAVAGLAFRKTLEGCNPISVFGVTPSINPKLGESIHRMSSHEQCTSVSWFLSQAVSLERLHNTSNICIWAGCYPLSGLTPTTNLETYRIHDGHNINLSNHGQLQSLQLEGCYQISVSGVTPTTNLKSCKIINCIFSHEQCTSVALSLSQAVSLERLHITSNTCIKAGCDGHIIDLSHHGQLQSLQIGDCYQIYVSCVTPTTNLKSCEIINCKFSHEQCTSVASFLSQAVSLERLHITSNRCIKAGCDGHIIDLSHHGQLQSLQIGDCYQIHVSGVTPTTNLKSCEIINCKFSHEQCTSVASFLSQAVSLERLRITSNRCIKAGCDGHGIDLSHHEQLQSLQFIGCHQIYVTGVTPTTNLKACKIDRSLLTHKQYTSLASNLSQAVSSERLYLSETICKKVGCDGHIIDLSHHEQLESLELDRCNKISVSGVISSTNFKECKIRYCTLSHEQYTLFSSFLSQAVSLERLDFITNTCVKAGCDGHIIDLSHHRQLQSLQLIGCYQIYVSGVTTSTNLKSCEIMNCKFSHEQCASVASLLSQAVSLERLHITSNRCIKAGCDGHGIDLSHHRQLQSLQLIGCYQIYVTGVTPTTNLKSCEIINCKFSHEQCTSVASFLSQAVSLERLRITSNTCKEVGCYGHNIDLYRHKQLKIVGEDGYDHISVSGVTPSTYLKLC